MCRTFLPASAAGLCPLVLILAGCSDGPVPEDPPVPVASAPEEPPLVIEDGFRVLRLSDFDAFPAGDDTWREEGDVITCTADPKGSLQ